MGTPILYPWTARVTFASPWPREQQRHLNRERDAIAGAIRVRFGVRAEHGNGMGMARGLEHGLGLARLDEPAQIHPRYTVGP